jgi:hypothetical protein
MPANELNVRKKEMVQQLNAFIGMKKAYSQQSAQRGELLEGAKSATPTVESESLLAGGLNAACCQPPTTAKTSWALCIVRLPCVRKKGEDCLRGLGAMWALGGSSGIGIYC